MKEHTCHSAPPTSCSYPLCSQDFCCSTQGSWGSSPRCGRPPGHSQACLGGFRLPKGRSALCPRKGKGCGGRIPSWHLVPPRHKHLGLCWPPAWGDSRAATPVAPSPFSFESPPQFERPSSQLQVSSSQTLCWPSRRRATSPCWTPPCPACCGRAARTWRCNIRCSNLQTPSWTRWQWERCDRTWVRPSGGRDFETCTLGFLPMKERSHADLSNQPAILPVIEFDSILMFFVVTHVPALSTTTGATAVTSPPALGNFDSTFLITWAHNHHHRHRQHQHGPSSHPTSSSSRDSHRPSSQGQTAACWRRPP